MKSIGFSISILLFWIIQTSSIVVSRFILTHSPMHVAVRLHPRHRPRHPSSGIRDYRVGCALPHSRYSDLRPGDNVFWHGLCLEGRRIMARSSEVDAERLVVTVATQYSFGMVGLAAGVTSKCYLATPSLLVYSLASVKQRHVLRNGDDGYCYT